MNSRFRFLLIILSLTLLTSCQAQENTKDKIDFPVLKGKYLGQKPPGKTPTLFLSSILSLAVYDHGKITFSPDGKEVYWACMGAQAEKRMVLKQNQEGIWNQPEKSFLSVRFRESGLSFSPDGKKAFFHSRRPLKGTGDLKDADIWYRNRIENGWSEPINIGAPINTNKMVGEYAPIIAADGTIYFCREVYDGPVGSHGHRSGKQDIYYSKYVNGKYTEPVKLGPEINTEFHEIDPAISPDNSFLVFVSRRPGGYSNRMNLYVSFRKPDNTWTQPICLSEILKIDNIWFPSITHDGKYLLFNGDRKTRNGPLSDHYWVDVKIIKELRKDTVGIAQKNNFANEKNNKLPSWKTEIKEGDAFIWYLGACGFAVKTKNHFLIFDYEEKYDEQWLERPDKLMLSNGYINPSEVKDLNICVFVTHAHPDHFDPVIFEWEKIVRNIEYFFGWDAKENPIYHYMEGPRDELKIGGTEIYTINSHHAGISEVAYLVKVDGLVIYHNGDYKADYKKDMEYLKSKMNGVDLAFLIGEVDEEDQYFIQSLYFLEGLKPKAIFPMHHVNEEHLYKRYAMNIQSKGLNNKTICFENKGDRFYYQNSENTKMQKVMSFDEQQKKSLSANDVKLQILYDNNPYVDDLQTDPGFSCLIRIKDRTLLFDAGRIGKILMSNIEKLEINPADIEKIVISHNHSDHICGLPVLLKECNKPEVYIAKAMANNVSDYAQGLIDESIKSAEKHASKVIKTTEPLKICDNVYTTGVMGDRIPEQALIIQTNAGLIVITGCGHPGVVELTRMAKELLKQDVLLVIGGFHLMGKQPEDIQKVVTDISNLTHHIAPCHCAGDVARELFKRTFGKNYIKAGVGKTIDCGELTRSKKN